jgi:hypothetical protein
MLWPALGRKAKTVRRFATPTPQTAAHVSPRMARRLPSCERGLPEPRVSAEACSRSSSTHFHRRSRRVRRTGMNPMTDCDRADVDGGPPRLR